MSELTGRLKREHETLVCMTRIYCRHHHAWTGDGLCPECSKLMKYAGKRLEKCPYGEEKPTCAKCPIHCYKPEPRETVREVMRFAGPKMTLKHPIRSVTHIYDKLRSVEHPMKLRKSRGKAERRRGGAVEQNELKDRARR